MKLGLSALSLRIPCRDSSFACWVQSRVPFQEFAHFKTPETFRDNWVKIYGRTVAWAHGEKGGKGFARMLSADIQPLKVFGFLLVCLFGWTHVCQWTVAFFQVLLISPEDVTCTLGWSLCSSWVKPGDVSRVPKTPWARHQHIRQAYLLVAELGVTVVSWSPFELS